MKISPTIREGYFFDSHCTHKQMDRCERQHHPPHSRLIQMQSSTLMHVRLNYAALARAIILYYVRQQQDVHKDSNGGIVDLIKELAAIIITLTVPLFYHISRKSKYVESSITHLQNALQQISSWMTANPLTHKNSSKTEFLLIGLKQQK